MIFFYTQFFLKYSRVVNVREYDSFNFTGILIIEVKVISFEILYEY